MSDKSDAVPEPLPVSPSRVYDTLDVRIRVLEQIASEHKTRLENGGFTIREHESKIEGLRDETRELERKQAPKPVDMWKYVIFTVSTVITVLVSLWALANNLAARPTAEQVREMIRVYSAPQAGAGSAPGKPTTGAP